MEKERSLILATLTEFFGQEIAIQMIDNPTFIKEFDNLLPKISAMTNAQAAEFLRLNLPARG